MWKREREASTMKDNESIESFDDDFTLDLLFLW